MKIICLNVLHFVGEAFIVQFLYFTPTVVHRDNLEIN